MLSIFAISKHHSFSPDSGGSTRLQIRTKVLLKSLLKSHWFITQYSWGAIASSNKIASYWPGFFGFQQQTSDQIYSTKTEPFHGWSQCLVGAEDLPRYAEWERKTNIKHHRQPDDLRARFKVPEWGVFCHTARLRDHPPRLKLVLSDSAQPVTVGSWSRMDCRCLVIIWCIALNFAKWSALLKFTWPL